MQQLSAFIIMYAVCGSCHLFGQTVKEYVPFGDRVVASESRVVTGNVVGGVLVALRRQRGNSTVSFPAMSRTGLDR